MKETEMEFPEQPSNASNLDQLKTDLIKNDSDTAISLPQNLGDAHAMIHSMETRLKLLEKQLVLVQSNLETSEDKVYNYKSIFDNMQDAYYEALIDGTILEVGQSIEVISRGKYKREELIGQSVLNFYENPAQREHFYNELTKNLSVTDFDVPLRNKDGSIIQVAISSKLLPATDNSPAKIIGSIRDITTRKQSEKYVMRLLHNESILSKISEKTLVTHSLDEFLDFALAELGNSLDVSRVYIFEQFIDSGTISNTYEWCADGIIPQMEELQDVPSNFMPWWMETLIDNRFICYSAIEEIPDEAVKEILRPQNIQSILVVPLIVGGKFWGFMGFDDCLQHRMWLPEDIDILNAISHLISGFIERKRSEIALEEAFKQLNIVNQHLEERVELRTREILHLSNLHEAIINNAGLGIISTDAAGIIQTFNSAAQKQLGYSAEEVVGKQMPVIFHDPEELLQISRQIGTEFKADENPGFELFGSLIRKNIPTKTEWTFVRKDGTKFPVKLTLSSFKTADGTLGGYIGVAMDVSMESQTLLALRESEERFHNMFHDHSALMLLVDPETGEIEDANKAARELYGFDFDAKQKKSIYDINSMTKAGLANEMGLAVKRKLNYFEFVHKKVTGETFPVEVHSTPIEVRGKKVLFSIIHDTTERKKIEQALKNSEKTLNQITDCVPVFIALASKDLTYTFANMAYEEFFRKKKSELIGSKISDILPPEAYKRAYPFMLKALSGESSTFENRIVNGEGEEHILETTYLPFYHNNSIEGILANVIDVTSRVQSEELLKRSEAENRGILSAIPDMMFRLNKEGEFLSYHSENQETLYVPENMFIGKSIAEVLPPNLAELAGNTLEKAFQIKETATIEYELMIDNEIRYYENRFHAISDKEALSIVRDITQKTRIEKALLWNEAFLKKMTESSPLAFLVVDNRTDDILYINHQFCEIWGINHLEEAIRRGELKNNDIIPDCLPVLSDIPAFAESCKPLQDENNRVVVEDEIAFINGRTIRRFSTQIRDAADQYHGRLYIFEEITERKNAEKLILMQRDLATRLNETTNLKEALMQSLDSILQIQNIDAGGIYLLDPVDSDLRLIFHRGLSDQFIADISHFAADSAQAKMVMKGDPIYGLFQPSIISDSSSDQQEQLLGLAVIPIKHEGKVIGALNLGSKTTSNFYANIQVYLESLTVQLGGAISRINAENSLFASQENFRILFDTINDFMFILDLEGMILRTNSVVEKRLDYTAEELKKMHVLELHPLERREEAGFIVDEMLAGRMAYCPVPLRTKEGKLIPVETHVILGQWDGADVLFGISRDTTERERNEAALKMQSIAFESFALPIIITDVNGVIQWSNSSFTRLSGYKPDEIFGKNNSELVKSGEQDKDFYEKLWATILNGEVWSGELINRRKDGSRYPEELTITPVMDNTGIIRSFIAIKIDITVRKEMETALRESEARWNFAFEGSGDGVWDWNASTNIVFFSSQWKSMLGYSDAEIGNSLAEWDSRIHPEDRIGCYAALEKHFSGETEIYSSEHRVLCKDGSYKWILDRGKVVSWLPDGQPLRVIGTHTDVSKIKEFEESLKSAIAKEKELNELKSRFVSMASHEFRTPLASILMMSDSLMAYWKKMDDHQINLKLQNIKVQVQHLARVVTDVMQVAKIQEGKLSYEPTNIDFVKLCWVAVNDFNTDQLLKNKIQFDCHFETLNMHLDSRLIIQVLNNLLSNAIKYSQPNPIVKIRLAEDFDNIVLQISDNGIGVPAEEQDKLFQPFYRAENAKQIQGNGLGLNIVRESVLLHGGNITFSSMVGKGSTFTIHLPKILKVIEL